MRLDKKQKTMLEYLVKMDLLFYYSLTDGSETLYIRKFAMRDGKIKMVDARWELENIKAMVDSVIQTLTYLETDKEVLTSLRLMYLQHIKN